MPNDMRSDHMTDHPMPGQPGELRIDLHDEVAALCHALGLDPNIVAELVVQPRHVRAIVYLLNDEGRKYVDVETGRAALEEREFEVRA